MLSVLCSFKLRVLGSVRGFVVLVVFAGPASMGASEQDSCSVEGLAVEWDGLEEIRLALRAGKSLIVEVSEKATDIHLPCRYSAVIQPLLRRMAASDKKLPGIDGLRAEVRTLLQMNSREPDDTDIERTAWLLRKQLGFVKMKARRREVSYAARYTCYTHFLYWFLFVRAAVVGVGFGRFSGR